MIATEFVREADAVVVVVVVVRSEEREDEEDVGVGGAENEVVYETPDRDFGEVGGEQDVIIAEEEEEEEELVRDEDDGEVVEARVWKVEVVVDDVEREAGRVMVVPSSIGKSEKSAKSTKSLDFDVILLLTFGCSS